MLYSVIPNKAMLC